MPEMFVVIDGDWFTCKPQPAPSAEPARVIAYSQRDERWAGARMAYTSQTVGGMGCAMLTACMVLSQRRPDITPLLFNARANIAGGYNIVNGNEAHLAWDRLPGPGMFSELKWLGRESWTRSLYEHELTRVFGFIDEGPLPLWVDFKPQQSGMQSHFVLATGHGDGDIEIVDPWGGDRVGLLERYGRGPGDTLARAVWGYRRLVVV